MGGFFSSPSPSPAPRPAPVAAAPVAKAPETKSGRKRRLAKQRHQRGGISEDQLFVVSKLGKPVPAQNVGKPMLG